MKKLLLLLVLIIVACGKKEEEVKEVVLRPVKYQKIEKVSSNLERDFSGIVKAEKESKLSFKVSGTVNKKYFNLGEKVEKNDVLAKLDEIDYEVKYQKSIASLEQTKASYIQANADFERVQKLYFNDNVSKAEYDGALAQFKSAKAQVKASEKQVEYDNLQLGYTKLLAPASGVIADELSEENETISAGTPIYILSLDGDLELEFFMPESLISQIKVGQEVAVNVDIANGKDMIGKIKEVSSVSTGFGQTFLVKAKLINPSEDIKSGMTAKIKMSLDFSEEEVIILPLASVITDSEGKEYVYTLIDVKDGVGTVEKSSVEIGKVTTKGLEILNGIEGGDLVVTGGMSKINEGEKVGVPSEEDR